MGKAKIPLLPQIQQAQAAMAANTPIPEDRSFGGRLQQRLPGMSVKVETDALTDEIRITTRLKLRTYIPAAVDEELELRSMVDGKMIRYGSLDTLAEMYSEMIRKRMAEEINSKAQPNPEIRALMAVAGCACKFNIEHGYFHVWHIDGVAGGGKSPEPAQEIDQEATIEQWREMLSDMVDVAALRKKHPRLRIGTAGVYNERSLKRQDYMRGQAVKNAYESGNSLAAEQYPPSMRGMNMLAPYDPREREREHMIREIASRMGMSPSDAAKLVR